MRLFGPDAVRSLASRTDLLFHRVGGVLTPRGGYLVVATPANPRFYFGNLLLFRSPPAAGDRRRWEELFQEEFAAYPDVRHRCFTWDTTDGHHGAAAEFVDAGYTLEEAVVLTAERIKKPDCYSPEAVVRPLASDDDWEQATLCQIDSREPSYAREGYELFKRPQMERYRAMAAAGLGAFYGAFLGERLGACLGLYFEAKLGRFQQVATHPELRRLGLCGRLVHDVSHAALASGRARTLVMVADEHYHAARIYESVGFKPAERQGSVFLRPKEDMK